MPDHNTVQSDGPPIQDVLIVWLQQHLRPTARATGESPSSYLVKHIAERAIGRYVSERDLRDVARQLGYPLSTRTIGVRWRDLGKVGQ